MRANRAFLNYFGVGLDKYDGYVRDGPAPWNDQLNRVHELIDANLGLDHPGVESP